MGYWCIGATISFFLAGMGYKVYRTLQRGRLDFWRVAAVYPDAAFRFFQSSKDWSICPASRAAIKTAGLDGAEWTGPFRLVVPCLGNQLCVIYGKRSELEASQERFLQCVKNEKAINLNITQKQIKCAFLHERQQFTKALGFFMRKYKCLTKRNLEDIEVQSILLAGEIVWTIHHIREQSYLLKHYDSFNEQLVGNCGGELLPRMAPYLMRYNELIVDSYSGEGTEDFAAFCNDVVSAIGISADKTELAKQVAKVAYLFRVNLVADISRIFNDFDTANKLLEVLPS